MRISGARELVGSASDVNVLEIIQGERRRFAGVLQDTSVSPAVPQDISTWEIESVGKWYTASTNQGASVLTLSNTQKSPRPDTTLPITMLSGVGEFAMDIPSDLYTDTLIADANTDVPILVVYTRVVNGPTETALTGRIGRTVIIVRAGLGGSA